MKAYRGSRNINPPILNLGVRRRLAVKATPPPFYNQESDPVPSK
jgi:hypothetical protein